MQKCLIIINRKSGNHKKVHADLLQKVFGKGFETSVFYIDEGHLFQYVPADRVVICGGDGTLNSILNVYRRYPTEMIYCPCGTLNETAKKDEERKGDFYIKKCGMADEKMFSYVLATGVFTPLGYAVKNKTKQKFKAFAYIGDIIRQLKVWRINAKLEIDGEKTEGQYSLLMFLDSPRCFGFKCNRMYRTNGEKLALLAIKAPKYNGFLGLCELFFPYFRAFFIGFGKPYRSSRLLFRECASVEVKTETEFDFCVDGERWKMPKDFTVSPAVLSMPIRVVTAKKLNKYTE